MLQIRMEHQRLGYTPAADAKGPDRWLEDKAERYLYRAKLTRKSGNEDARLKRLRSARKGYARAAALLLAAIDRIDWILAHQGDD